MNPTQFEQSISEYLSTVLIMPVFAFAQNPRALKEIGENGVCVIVYNGSNFEGNSPLIKRTLTASIMIIATTPKAVHAELDKAYSALQGHILSGCNLITVISDEISLLDSGLYHGLMMIETVIVNS